MNKSKNNKKIVVDFTQAEINARKRDLEVKREKLSQKRSDQSEHSNIAQEVINDALEALRQATGKDVYVGTRRSAQSRVRFAQIIQLNFLYLNKNKYITSAEKVFLMDIIPYIAFSSNCIVINIKDKNPVPANITEIGKLIGRDRKNISPIINSLKKKGIVAKAESGVEGNNVKAYAIFLNPHIIYAGDKESVNETLKAMFYKAMKMPIIKDLPIKLF